MKPIEKGKFSFKNLLSIIGTGLLVIFLFISSAYFAIALKNGMKENKTNDSLMIVKLKLEIQLKKMELGKKDSL